MTPTPRFCGCGEPALPASSLCRFCTTARMQNRDAVNRRAREKVRSKLADKLRRIKRVAR